MQGVWTIEDEHKIARFQSEWWSNKCTHNEAIASEATIILDLVTTVAKNIWLDDYWMLKVCADFKVVCDLLIA